jgi:hypothetical protein
VARTDFTCALTADDQLDVLGPRDWLDRTHAVQRAMERGDRKKGKGASCSRGSRHRPDPQRACFTISAMAASPSTKQHHLRSKFSVCYSSLFAGEDIPQPAERWFDDLFCLRPDPRVVVQLAGDADVGDPGDPAVKRNISLLFVAAVRALRDDTDEDDPRRENVVEVGVRSSRVRDIQELTPVQTLIPLLRCLLAKRYSNYAYDIIQLLAGSLERSDGVFMVLFHLVSTPLFFGPGL